MSLIMSRKLFPSFKPGGWGSKRRSLLSSGPFGTGIRKLRNSHQSHPLPRSYFLCRLPPFLSSSSRPPDCTGCCTGNWEKISCSQAEAGQASKSAIVYVSSNSDATPCQVVLYFRVDGNENWGKFMSVRFVCTQIFNLFILCSVSCCTAVWYNTVSA